MRDLFDAVRHHCPGLDPALLDAHFGRLAEDYFERHTAAEIARHVKLLAGCRTDRPLAVEVHPLPGRAAEVVVAGSDRPGIVACITAALAADGFDLSELHVSLYREDGRTPDTPVPFVIHLRGDGLTAMTAADAAARLADRLLRAHAALDRGDFAAAQIAATGADGHAPPGPARPVTDTGLPPVLGGDFRRERLLAVGGMSEVYLATQTSLRRTVAVKVSVAQASPDPAALDRFTREALTLARFQCPYIVPVLATGSIPTGGGTRAWIAMEYLPGGDLGAWLRRHGPPPVPAGVRWLRQALHALRYAHRHGVLHRDLKPHNLLLTAEGDLKAADWGLFQPVATAAVGKAAVCGTPPYMSPEQATGGALDERSDLFSLGTTFFEVFTGRRPFPGPDTAAVMSRIAGEDAPRLTEVAPQLPVPLAVIVGRLLARDPAARYQDARVALDDLASYEERGLLAGEPDHAGGTSSGTDVVTAAGQATGSFAPAEGA
jgi:hypothetical protein